MLKKKWCGNCFCCACIMLVELVKTTMLLEAGGRSQNFKLHIFMKQKTVDIYIYLVARHFDVANRESEK